MPNMNFSFLSELPVQLYEDNFLRRHNLHRGSD